MLWFLFFIAGYSLLGLAFLGMVIYLIVERIEAKKKENFEDRPY